MDSGSEKKFITTTGPILSVKLSATGASEMHGFIAEIVTLPISAIGFSMLNFFLTLSSTFFVKLYLYSINNPENSSSMRDKTL